MILYRLQKQIIWRGMLTYARYPNNLLLLFILEKVFRIVLIIVPDISVEGLQSCSIILSFVCVQLAISILYITLRQLWERKSIFNGNSTFRSCPIVSICNVCIYRYTFFTTCCWASIFVC